MEVTPNISVVIPVHNRVLFLREALLSLQAQTFENLEVIVVDDKSEEDIRMVVESLSDPRMCYVFNSGKKGISSARNFGNNLARASCIAVADSDDINLPRRLKVTVDFFATHPNVDIFYGNMYTFENDSLMVRQYDYFSPYSLELLLHRDFIPNPTVAYRKDVLKRVSYDESLSSAEDYDFFLNAATRHGMRFGWTEEPLVLYRRHAEQDSKNAESSLKQRENARQVRQKYSNVSK